MAHLVRHRTPAGDTVTHEVGDLDEAVARVERLRNDDKAEDVRVFAEVPLQFETYVRVKVAEAPAPPPAADTPAASDPVVDDDEPAPAPPAEPAAPPPPPPGVLTPVRVDVPSADADELVDATPVESRRTMLFHRGSGNS